MVHSADACCRERSAAWPLEGAVPEDATRRKLLPNAAVIEDDDGDDAGTEPELRLMEDDDVEEVEWGKDRCGVGIDGAVVTVDAAAAGDAVGRRKLYY